MIFKLFSSAKAPVASASDTTMSATCLVFKVVLVPGFCWLCEFNQEVAADHPLG
jgi:hypothetical protein